MEIAADTGVASSSCTGLQKQRLARLAAHIRQSRIPQQGGESRAQEVSGSACHTQMHPQIVVARLVAQARSRSLAVIGGRTSSIDVAFL